MRDGRRDARIAFTGKLRRRRVGGLNQPWRWKARVGIIINAVGAAGSNQAYRDRDQQHRLGYVLAEFAELRHSVRPRKRSTRYEARQTLPAR